MRRPQGRGALLASTAQRSTALLSTALPSTALLSTALLSTALLSTALLSSACGARSGTSGAGSGSGSGNGNGNGNGAGGVNGGAPPGAADGVRVRLVRIFPEAAGAAAPVVFGVPLAAATVVDAGTIRVTTADRPLAARVRPLLTATGGLRALQLQLPADTVGETPIDVDVRWDNAAAQSQPTPPAGEAASWADVTVDSAATVELAARTIARRGDAWALVETSRETRVLFTGHEPRVLATFPPGYLAASGFLGQQVTQEAAHAPAWAGLAFLSDALVAYGLAAMYVETYRLDPNPDAVADPIADYEAWLYDRCATFLTAYTHTGDARFLRHALRTCSWYAGQIGADGIFRGKPDPDPKYSHARGLTAYYALTGDERARAAVVAIADMWDADRLFTSPYRQGRLRKPDGLWTERLLAAALEGFVYGYRVTRETKYLDAARELVDTAYEHVTGDAATLAALNPGTPAFPPQNCFIHTAAQHGEGNDSDPWCSGWMSELAVDALLRYQEDTADPHVDEIFVRLARFLRDVGTVYFDANPADDTFLSPTVCDAPDAGVDRRRLVPLYGSGLGVDGKRRNFVEFSDYQHCADATALTAVALRALRRQGSYDANPIGPFASEGASLLALHLELADCARRVFENEFRPRRDPAAWTSEELAPGAGDPAAFLVANKIGWPSHVIAPLRKVSWWFNTALLQFGLLAEAGVQVPELTPPRLPCASRVSAP